MKVNKYNIRGTEMNKLQFSEIEDYLEAKGININEAFELLADENEFIYVSNGFINGLTRNENEDKEWHHYFKKDIDGHFVAGKMIFK